MRAEHVHQGQGGRQAEPGHGPREGWVYGLLAVLFIIIVSMTAGGVKDRSPLLLRYPPLHQEILYTCMYRCGAGGTSIFFFAKNAREHSTGYPSLLDPVGTEAPISFLWNWRCRPRICSLRLTLSPVGDISHIIHISSSAPLRG